MQLIMVNAVKSLTQQKFLHIREIDGGEIHQILVEFFQIFSNFQANPIESESNGSSPQKSDAKQKYRNGFCVEPPGIPMRNRPRNRDHGYTRKVKLFNFLPRLTNSRLFFCEISILSMPFRGKNHIGVSSWIPVNRNHRKFETFRSAKNGAKSSVGIISQPEIFKLSKPTKFLVIIFMHFAERVQIPWTGDFQRFYEIQYVDGTE